MDCGDDVSERDTLKAFIHSAAKRARIIDEARHFAGRAAIPELQVVQHLVVLLGETLVRILYILGVGTHHVPVISHV